MFLLYIVKISHYATVFFVWDDVMCWMYYILQNIVV